MFCASRRRSPAQARPDSTRSAISRKRRTTHYTSTIFRFSIDDERGTRVRLLPFLTLARPDLALASAREDAIAGAERGRDNPQWLASSNWSMRDAEQAPSHRPAVPLTTRDITITP